MRVRHFTIPVFIPEEACPNRCFFCNQNRIAGAECAPSVDEVVTKVDSYLLTIPIGSDLEIGFSGDNFTGIPVEEQKANMALVQPYIESGSITEYKMQKTR
jgi:histone acetyltransferase (RNA polymerase elongator complex component)